VEKRVGEGRAKQGEETYYSKKKSRGTLGKKVFSIPRRHLMQKIKYPKSSRKWKESVKTLFGFEFGDRIEGVAANPASRE